MRSLLYKIFEESLSNTEKKSHARRHKPWKKSYQVPVIPNNELTF